MLFRSFNELSNGKYRSPDPSLHAKKKFLYRRLAPDSRKLDLELLTGRQINRHLLQAMGRDLGAVHAANGGCKAIQLDLSARSVDWLVVATKKAAMQVKREFKEYRTKAVRS